MEFGWIPNPAATEAFVARLPAVYGDQLAELVARDDGRDALNYQALSVCLSRAGLPQWLRERDGIPCILSLNQGPVGTCFPAETPVLMDDGIERPIEEVDVGDRVTTHLGRGKRVSNVMRRLFTGPLYSVRVRGWKYPLRLTGEHPVAIAKNDGGWEWVQAKDIRKGQYVLMSKGNTQPQAHVQSIDLSSYLSTDTQVGEDFVRVIFGKRLPRYIALDERFGRLIGLYLAEGGIGKTPSGFPGRVVFAFHAKETELHAFVVDSFREIFGVEAKVVLPTGRSNSAYVRCEHSTLAQFFSAFCPGNVYTKEVPPAFYCAPEAVRLALIRGWLDGDGHTRLAEMKPHLANRSLQACGVTASEALHRSIYRLALGCDLRPGSSIRKQESHQQVPSRVVYFYSDDVPRLRPGLGSGVAVANGRKKNHKPHSLGSACCVERVDVVEVVQLPVYNIEVEDDNSYVANGVIVHNCVGNAEARLLDVLASVEIVLWGEYEEFHATFSPEGLYGLGREKGGMLGPGDGLYGAAIADAVREWGTLHQTVYGDIDLREYDPGRCREYGRRGVPASLRAIAAAHLVVHAARVRSAEEGWALLGSGYTINICSSLGFQGNRDAEGIVRRRGRWMHSMAVTSRRTTQSGNRLVLVHQSWGNDWTGGPYWQDMPWGSFWIHLEDFDAAVQQGDTFAHARYQGFTPRQLPDFGTKEYLG